MRMLVWSASASVTRTLEQLVLRSGHSLATDPISADLILYDPVHRKPLNAPHAPLFTLQSEQLTPPFTPRQLIRLLRQYQNAQPLLLARGWQLDLATRTLRHDLHPSLTLTEKECALLAALAGEHPAPVTREALLADVWGMRHEIDTHTLETHIYRLRSKLSTATEPPADIVTLGGAYRLTLDKQG